MSKLKKKKYRVYNGKSIKKIIENSKNYFLLFLFAVGVAAGAYSMKNDTSILSSQWKIITDSYISLRTEQGILANLLAALTVNGLYFSLSIFFAFSLIGYPILVTLPFFRGLGVGAICGYMYLNFGVKGIGFCLLTIYPGLIISVMALSRSVCESCVYSQNAYQKAINGRGQFEKDETKIMMIRHFVYFGFAAVSTVLDCIMGYIFSRFFVF